MDSMLKSRDITLPIKVHLVKAMIFPVVMYGCKAGPLKKKKMSAEELVFNCGAGEEPWESCKQQKDQTSQS